MEDSTNNGLPGHVNGKANSNGSVNTRLAAEEVRAATPTKQSKRHRIVYRLKQVGLNSPTPDSEESGTPKPSQLISAKVSAFVARYPFQTIGGLLIVLLMIVAFKTFYQGKHWKAKRRAEEAFYVANEYARNNSTNLYPYLSNAFRREVRQLPGLLPLSMQTATRGGTITAAEATGLREITPDSVVVEVNLVFGSEGGTAKREEKCFQALVYEKDQWRLGLSYSR